MRKLAILSLTLALGASTASAQRGAGPPLGDDDFRPTMQMLTGMLELSPAQVEAIEPLRDSLVEATRDTRARALQAREELRLARQRAAPADTLAQLQDRVRGAMMALMPYRMEFMNSVKQHLTEEQAQRLEAHHQEMMAQMHQEMGMPPMKGKAKGNCEGGDCPRP